MTLANPCSRCRSAACDGRTVTCLGCGVVQCHGNGLGRGSCAVCTFGILPGWSSWRKTCGYKGCTRPAAFHHVPGSVKNVCHEHAYRPKVTLMTVQPIGYSSPTKVVKVSLAEYVTRGGLAARVGARGVVPAGEDHDPWPVYPSEEDERVIETCATGARRLFEMRDAAVSP